MNIIKFENSDKNPKVVALGFFDCLHLGHVAIIEKTKTLAKKHSLSSAVFTFENDVHQVVSNSSGLIFSYEERLKKLEKLSIDTVISQVFTKEFSKINARDFFLSLIERFCVKSIVCGEDYRFGFRGEADVKVLQKYCQEADVTLSIVKEVKYNEERISTTKIKDLILNGDVKTANKMLGDSYFISGEVSHGREVGRKLGFPTANVVLSSEKAKLKLGVYKTHVYIDGKRYNCITNYGGRPTYNLEEVLTETYIDGFSGDLYARQIEVYFDEYLRECKKFDSELQLSLQIKRDLESIR